MSIPTNFKPITDPSIPTYSSPNVDDVFHVVDVSDTTDSAAGTSKRAKLSDVVGLALPTAIQFNTYEKGATVPIAVMPWYIVQGAAPSATDDASKGFRVGTIWDFSGVKYRLSDATTGAAVWGVVFELSGENYVVLNMNGTQVENRAELDAAYAFAKTLTIDATNRYTIVIPPCYIDGETVNFLIDTPFIDIKSLTGKPDVYFVNGTVEVNTNSIHLVGLNVADQNFTLTSDDATNLYEHCVGGNDSFGGSVNARGTFNNCIGGFGCFGGGGNASGTFNNCIGANSSFGGGNGGDASGTFNNCIGEGPSFGGDSGTASGTFNNCIGGNSSFGGGGGTFTGYAAYCRITDTTNFPTVSGGGITRFCINGDNTADNQG
jgi:hypothetical protein